MVLRYIFRVEATNIGAKMFGALQEMTYFCMRIRCMYFNMEHLKEYELAERINKLSTEKEPFLFIINYKGTEAYISKLSEIDPKECLYNFEGTANVSPEPHCASNPHPKWKVTPPKTDDYKHSFEIVKANILAGNSYLTNLTSKVTVDCDLPLSEIFKLTKSKYKLLLKDSRCNREFVCFSPETFVKIKKGRIFAYPMKGTLDASLPNAKQLLMDDAKETAEHATIVDLIRNDLSKIADNVTVDRYRYIDTLHTNKGDILQTSSEISGELPADYPNRLGDLLTTLLPAGSITGAPKRKTMEIIDEAEGYDRGFYTGVMGIYDEGELNSAVMIRFLEQDGDAMCFKAGGGITAKSDCRKEYEELVQKVYLPINTR